MGYIYKIWNEDNDKLYIGQTSIDIKTRWSQHLRNYLTNDTAIYRAMRKHGAGIFHIEEIEECDNSLLNEREIYWIAFYDSYKNGYNSKPGGTALPTGNAPKRIDDKLVKQLWDEGYSISDIIEKTGASSTGIRDHLINYKNYSVEESNKRAYKKSGATRRIPIAQWDLQGNFIASYEYITQASKITHIPLANIAKCITKERQTAGNFYWTKNNELPQIKSTIIEQYDLQGNLIATYATKQQAANKLHLDSGTIAKVCQGKRKTHGGFIWREVPVNLNKEKTDECQ